MDIFGKKMSPSAFKDFFHRLVLIWYFSHKYLFLVFLIATTAYGVWFWKQSVYQYHWSDAQKQEYINQHARETSFKEDKFKAILEVVREKEQSFQEKGAFRDIFYAPE